jgi:hypothetical protein
LQRLGQPPTYMNLDWPPESGRSRDPVSAGDELHGETARRYAG